MMVMVVMMVVIMVMMMVMMVMMVMMMMGSVFPDPTTFEAFTYFLLSANIKK